MYYEEKVINGKLCYRADPKGKFKECSREYITGRLIEEIKEKQKYKELWEKSSGLQN